MTNVGYDFVSRVEGPNHGATLAAYLAARFPHSNVGTWAARAAAGLVLVDGASVAPEAILRSGQTVTWRRPGWEEPPAPSSVDVLYEDDDILAVAKPAGLPTLPGGGYLDNTLLSVVRRIDAGASPVHRLGRHTSGVVLFARNRDAAASLSRQIAAREVHKRYRALASGDPRADTFDIDVPIGPVPHALLGTVHGARVDGRPARTHVRVLERRENVFLCDAVIDTGRPHQIRIHLAAAGHPLVGDPLYPEGGVPHPGTRALPGDPG